MRKLLLILFLLPVFASAQSPMFKLIAKRASSCSDADATKYFTASGITDPAVQTAICEFVVREKAASRWGTEVQAFYILGNGSFDACKYNLIDTTLYKLTSSGTITYSTGSGGGADPTSGAYLNTNFTPSTHLVSVNSGHLMFWSQENVNEGSTDMGVLSAYYFDMNLNLGTMYGRVNVTSSGSFLSSARPNTVGCFLNNRTSSTAVAIYEDGTSLASGSISATSRPTATVKIFTMNLSNFSTKKAAFASVGAGISNPSDYYNSVNTLKTDLGL